MVETIGFPELLRRSRKDRRWSQEQLAHEADTSPRHLSCLETGKSSPSRAMVLKLSRALDLDLRERNLMLQSAGFGALYRNRDLKSPEMAPVMHAIDLIMEQQEPYAALLLDRTWNVLRANRGGNVLLGAFVDENTSPELMGNLMKASLHPDGLKPYIQQWPEYAALAIARLEREVALHPRDMARHELLTAVRTYPEIAQVSAHSPAYADPMAVIHLVRGDLSLRLFSMVTTVGTPFDVTAQEVMLESFFPADDETKAWFLAQRTATADA